MTNTIIHGNMREGMWFGELTDHVKTEKGWAGKITWLPMGMLPKQHPLDKPVLAPVKEGEHDQRQL